MSTHTSIVYHIIWTPYKRKPIMLKEPRRELFNYMMGILKNKNCHVYRIDGVEDHLHIATSLHPSQSLAGLIKDMKLACTSMIKSTNLFKGFEGWQDGYAAFTHNYSSLDNLVNYIKNQEEHHKKVSFIDEYIQLLKDHGIDFDPKYLL
ncbi:IS200/IS605 family transposase [Aquiflexum sp.]|uniref:IS200/IS605 family transposase n=1 Tax=Aquiflexum sp. TaxID=1872584 RepID=UPI0035939B21